MGNRMFLRSLLSSLWLLAIYLKLLCQCYLLVLLALAFSSRLLAEQVVLRLVMLQASLERRTISRRLNRPVLRCHRRIQPFLLLAGSLASRERAQSLRATPCNPTPVGLK